MHEQTLIFMGPQGSGKGTQIDLLEKYLTEHDPDRSVLYHYTGERFREFMEGETYTARRVKESINKGNLQPDFLPIWLMADELMAHMKENTHVIFDGFPRSVLQAQVLETVFDFFERTNPKVIYLTLSEEVTFKRLLARGRDDDTEESIKKRLEYYRGRTLPLLEYFKENNHYEVCEVDGEQAIEDVHLQIRNALGI